MPYHLKRADDLYFVVDESGKKVAKCGMIKAKARKQMMALNMSLGKEKAPASPSSKKYAKKKDTTVGIKSPEEINRTVRVKEVAETKLVKEEPPSLKSDLDIMRKERKEMGTSMVKLAPESIELDSFSPKKLAMPVRKVKLESASAGSQSFEPKKAAAVEYKDMSTAQRKKLYEKYYEDEMKPEDLPKEVRKGYKTWMKRNT